MLPSINAPIIEETMSGFSNSQVPTEFRRQNSLNPSDDSFRLENNKSQIVSKKRASVQPTAIHKPKHFESIQNKIKIHFSCSDAMRQTQYNKLISTVNKFDTQRIKKAIREGKINRLIENERDDPIVLHNLEKANRRSAERNRTSTEMKTDIHKLDKSRKKNNDFLSKGTPDK